MFKSQRDYINEVNRTHYCDTSFAPEIKINTNLNFGYLFKANLKGYLYLTGLAL